MFWAGIKGDTIIGPKSKLIHNPAMYSLASTSRLGWRSSRCLSGEP